MIGNLKQNEIVSSIKINIGIKVPLEFNTVEGIVWESFENKWKQYPSGLKMKL